MKKIIIAGFPGTGKSTYASMENTKLNAIDLESSDFHWIYENGEKVKNPDWPNNYVEEIIRICNNLDDDNAYIMCSTHKEVLLKLKNLGMRFIIVAPYSKDVYIKRYINRGSSESFIKSLNDNWDNYMDDIKSYNVHTICSDKYISDLFDSMDYYRYRMHVLEHS